MKRWFSPAGRISARTRASSAILRVTVAVVLLSAFLNAFVPVPVARANPRPRAWAFYVSYDPSSRQSLVDHVGQLDVVAPVFFSVDAFGSVQGADDPSIDAVVKAAGKMLLPVVTNRASASDLSVLLSDPRRRQAVVAELADLAATPGYDGIVLDYEGVDAADRPRFTTFVQELATAVHASRKTLAVALPAKTSDKRTGWGGAYDDAALAAAADRIILMAYGFRTASGTPGPVSPRRWVAGSLQYELTRVPADRLVLGVGLWGYDWNLTRPGKARTRHFTQIMDLERRFGGAPTYDLPDASVEYTYVDSGEAHDVWYEDATTVQAKLNLAETANVGGVAFWRLGQEAPGVWVDLQSGGRADFAISRGWFFTEAGGGTGLGYRVEDDGVPFWREFQRLGGVGTLGYPSSRRFVGADGFTYQAFQRGVLQWRPEVGQAYLVNTFDDLTRHGDDASLARQGIPAPIADDGSGGDWNRARQIRFSWLTDPRIAATFRANPNPRSIPTWSLDQSIQLYGLPSSAPVRSGPFIVQRFQRISLQLWVDDVPGMPRPGSVVGILGGDLYKNAGLVPPDAAAPQSPSD